MHLTHTHTHTTWWESGRRLGLSQRTLPNTIKNGRKRQTSMFQAGIEPAIPRSERSQNHALDSTSLIRRCYTCIQQFKAYWSRDAPTSLTFNNCTLCTHCFCVFCIYLRTNSGLCHLQHKLIGFYNRDEKCLQRSTDWVFK